MIIAKVVGNLWTTQKEQGMDQLKLLIVQPINIKLEPLGNAIVAIDRIGSGKDELVVITQGSPAQRLINDKTSPVDAAVVGIVDSYETDK